MLKIYKEKIPSTDPRLGRHILHDSRSLDFAFDTSGLSIIDVEHKRLVPIFNQGQIGSCTGNAGLGAVNTEPFIQNPNPVYPPDENGAVKLYSDATQIDEYDGVYPPNDTGSSGLAIAKVLKNAGVISGYQHTFSLNDALKALSVYPVFVGVRWYDSMFHPDADGRVHPVGNIAGGHEIEAYKVDVANGRIWFHNSWGNQWGVNGDFYLTWADFNFLLGQNGDVTVPIPPTITPPPPAPVAPTLKLGDKGPFVEMLQKNLNMNGANLIVDGGFGLKTKAALVAFQLAHGLVGDGICGKKSWQAFAMIETITATCTQHGVEPLLGVSVAVCESGLNPMATLYNPPSKSTDRGLFQWNNIYHPEITDAMAFDPIQATILFCNAVKAGHLHGNWSASQPCWIKKLTADIIAKYGLA